MPPWSKNKQQQNNARKVVVVVYIKNQIKDVLQDSKPLAIANHLCGVPV